MSRVSQFIGSLDADQNVEVLEQILEQVSPEQVAEAIKARMSSEDVEEVIERLSGE